MHRTRPLQPAVEDHGSDAVAVLRSRGLQPTAQRVAVMRAVSMRPHATAATIEESVRTALGTVSRQAVYDVLAVLVDHGILRRIQPAGSPALYEDRVGDNHHHLICRGCGSTFDVDCAVGSVPCLTPVGLDGYQIEEAEVIYWGRCPACVGSSEASDGDEPPIQPTTP